MDQVPTPSVRRAALAAAVILAIQCVACDTSRMVSGVFQSDDAVIVDGVFPEGLWIELMLAQFGPDLTGIVRIYGEDQFMVPPDGGCPCRYVENGAVSGNQISLGFRSSADCPGSPETPLLIGSFTYVDPEPVVGQVLDDYITGTIIVEGGDRTTAREVTFHRVKVWDEVSDEDLLCDDPIVHGDNVARSAGVIAR